MQPSSFGDDDDRPRDPATKAPDRGVRSFRLSPPFSPHSFRLIDSHRAPLPRLIFGDKEPSYEELNRRVNPLVHRLIALVIKPESRVGIAAERSIRRAGRVCCPARSAAFNVLG